MNKFRLMTTVTATAFAVMVGSLAYGQIQTSGQQKCINTLDKDCSKTAATKGKDDTACVKAGTKGTGTASCVPSDTPGKVAATVSKASSDESGNGCLGANAPNFGYSSASTGTTAAIDEEQNLFTDVYGTTDVTTVISTTKADGKCQAAVSKDLEKLMATEFKQYLACKKGALTFGALDAAPLVACVQGPDPNSIAFDPKGKIAGSAAKLSSDAASKCGAVTIATDFPGGCSGSSAGTLGSCLDKKARCRICKMINKIDGLNVNCDLFDDGMANGSCVTCAINAAGRYTETTGPGELKVSTFAAFPFPAGSVTIQDVSAPDSNCVSNTVIPFPGGLTTPIFCVPALGYTVEVVQTGCGIGIIDSNGGSDLTVDEKGDTSFNGGTCHTTQSCGAFSDSSGLVKITVGDGVVDSCASGGTGNAMVSIPVQTTTWLAEDASCPDADSAPPEGGDTVITTFPQVLDQTTDRATAEFADLDGDTCFQKGVGPTGPYTTNQLCTGNLTPYPCCNGPGTGTCVGNGGVGTCIDFGAMTVTVAASGTIFSSAAPLHDLLFANILPSTISGPAPFGGATCGSPPQVPINFAGFAYRCIIAP